MIIRKTIAATMLAVCTLAGAFSAHAIIGIGVHYGLDNTLAMKDTMGEQLIFDNLKLNVNSFGSVPTAFANSTISGKDIPIKIDRYDWARHPFNMGAKVYMDVIPFIDAFEVSGNFGMWEYYSKLIYPKSITFKPLNEQPTDTNAPYIDRVNVSYDTTHITLDSLGLSNPFLKNTPYAKLQLDFTLRKYIAQFPPVLKTLKLYGGAGFSLVFATPIVSTQLIKDALKEKLNQTLDVNQLNSEVFGDKVMKAVGEEIWKQLFTPHYGCHIDLGAMVKIPILPIAVYVDGKYLILFDEPSNSVKLGGNGLQLNMGVALHF